MDMSRSLMLPECKISEISEMIALCDVTDLAQNSIIDRDKKSPKKAVFLSESGPSRF